jgi:hypothetical protein
VQAFVGRDEDRDTFMMEIDSIKIGKEGGVLELRVASVVDVFSPNTRDQQQSTMTASSTASISPEVFTPMRLANAGTTNRRCSERTTSTGFV